MSSETAPERRHADGVPTARERIDLLLDEDSFVELSALHPHPAPGPGAAQLGPQLDGPQLDGPQLDGPQQDGVVTGWGTIDGRRVFVFAPDFRISGEVTGEIFAAKIRELMDLAVATGAPVIGFIDGPVVCPDRPGVVTLLAEDERSCLADLRCLLSYLPTPYQQTPPYHPPIDRPDRRCEALLDIVPVDPRTGYDVQDVISEIVDDGEFLELQPHRAQNVVCVLARLDGHVVGLVANQPTVLAGALDIDAAEKAAWFVRTCEAFTIPLVTLVDVPGFLPGAPRETGGVIRGCAQLLAAYREATVPRVQVILRKAYGGAYLVMDSKPIGCGISFAWPSNEIAAMSADGAAHITFRKDLAAEHTERLITSFVAAEMGLVDEVIDPAETRAVLIRSLARLRTERPAADCTSG